MKVLFLNAGNETGGGMYHILRLLNKMQQDNIVTCILGVFEKKELYRRATEKHIETVYFKNDTRLSYPLLQKIIRFMKENRITHVHTHGPRANVYMNMIRRKLPAHWIVTVHSDPFFDFKDKGIYGKLLTRLHVQAIKNAHRIISVSDSFHFSLQEAGLQQKKIMTIHNGLDFTKTAQLSQHTREILGFSDDEFLIVKVARLEKVKDHQLALRAFAQLIKRQKKAKLQLLFIGDGKLRASLESLAKELGIKKQVHFFGERSDVPLFYEIADLTLLTSLSESFPYVLLESARARTPVVATDVGDVGRLLEHDHCGWIIPVGNVSACVTAMEEAMRLWEQGMLQNIGENLFTYASMHFSIDKCVNEVYNVYESM